MAPVRAQAPDAGADAMARSGSPDALSWWGEPGRPGWMPEAWQGTAYPAAFAGLVVGGWTLQQPGRAPEALPWPGVLQARAPLAWYDTLEVRPDGGGAGAGFGAGAAGLRAASAAPGRGARSTFSLASGDGGVDENALTVARGDSVTGFELEAMNGARGAASGVERGGRHRWGAGVRFVLGRNRFESSFGQRSAATQLAGGEQQAASGRSGELAWRWARGDFSGLVGFARGFDRHESFGGLLASSRREAQDDRLVAEAQRSRDGRVLGARLEWSRAQVKRFGSGAFGREARSLWATAHARLPSAAGRLDLALGAGYHGGVDRIDVAPSAVYSFRWRGLEAGATLERLLAPVWADLAAGQQPFLQHAWLGGVRAVTLRTRPWCARGELRAGRAYSRALADRLPLEELWLRRGLRAEAGTCDVLLADGGLEWEARHADAGLEGFALALRTPHSDAPRADPGAGFRVWLGGRTALFSGDLGVHVRAEVEGVGAREAEVGTVRRLPGFVTLGLAGEFVVGDATLTVRARNLEDREREQSWLDTSTGRLALAGRRDLRFTLTWRLFN